MGSDELKIGPADLLVKFEIGRAASAAALRVLVKNAADEERIISDVRAKQECLFRRGTGQRDQHVGNVLRDSTRSAHAARARDCARENVSRSEPT